MKKAKLKIRRSINRRFKVTKTGKVLRGASFHRHLNSKKKNSRVRRLNSTKSFTGKRASKIRQLLGK